MDDFVIKACGKRLIVKRLVEKPKPGQLIIPSAGDDSAQALVIAKGNEVSGRIDEGDVVVLQTRAGVPLKIGDMEFDSIIEHEILAIIPGKKVEESME
jgi:co-chaperonin GroES (HSP10)